MTIYDLMDYVFDVLDAYSDFNFFNEDIIREMHFRDDLQFIDTLNDRLFFTTNQHKTRISQPIDILLKINSKVSNEPNNFLLNNCFNWLISRLLFEFDFSDDDYSQYLYSKDDVTITSLVNTTDIRLYILVCLGYGKSVFEFLINNLEWKTEIDFTKNILIISCLRECLEQNDDIFNKEELDLIRTLLVNLKNELLKQNKSRDYRIHSFLTDDITMDDILSLIDVAVMHLRNAKLDRVIEYIRDINEDIKNDTEKVVDALDCYGFPEALKGLLRQFEEDYKRAGNDYDHSAVIGHVRTFLQELMIGIAIRVKDIKGVPFPGSMEKFGEAASYLRQKNVGFCSKQLDEMIVGLNSFLSGTGVHSVASQREEARIGKNMAIECAVFLFDRLDTFTGKSTP